jgi:hypothetical protein
LIALPCFALTPASVRDLLFFHGGPMRVRFIRVLLTASALMLIAFSVTAQQQQQPACAQAEARQFDFWVGEWEVHANGKVAGHNRISRIHGDCTVFEEYTAASSAYEGKSFNFYDPAGEAVVDRITWTPNEDGSVRQFCEISKDDGETWQVGFDGLYKRVE